MHFPHTHTYTHTAGYISRPSSLTAQYTEQLSVRQVWIQFQLCSQQLVTHTHTHEHTHKYAHTNTDTHEHTTHTHTHTQTFSTPYRESTSYTLILKKQKRS